MPASTSLAYRRSAQADADYLSIYRYGVERFGVTQAEANADRLDRAVEMLAVFPRAGRVRPEIDATIRTHSIGVHIVLYDVDEDDDVVVLRIPHAPSDWIND